MDIKQFYQTFFEEADELLAEMERLLLELDLQAPDMEQLNAIFRSAHSIKGGAATFGFQALTETTHLLENLLDQARHGSLHITSDMVGAFLETKDVLQKELSAYRADAEPEPEMVGKICEILRQLALESSAKGAASAVPVPVPAPVIEPEPPVVVSESVATPAGNTLAPPVLKVSFFKVGAADRKLLSEELTNLGTVVSQLETDDGLTLSLETSCDADDVIAVCCFIVDVDQIEVSLATLDPSPVAEHALASPVVLPNPVEPQQPEAPVPAPAPAQAVRAAKPVAAPAAAAPAVAANKDAGSIRVDVDKVDQIINLVGELVITQSMLTQIASTLDPALYERLLSCMGHLERNALDLQQSVMSIRMMPMDYVFSRFPRLIHDLSAKLGKQVQLVMIGKETELDKSLIERVIDPVTHLVRNSLDHGLESPEQRALAKKDPMGRLTLSAQHQGGSIVIEVRDDGAGLDRDKILAKAIQQGFDVDASIGDDELWQFIFAPGFSTAEVVSDVSGRGVGMDVVRRNIQEMGGHVEIASVRGQGTSIKIVLPLTLAILNGMSIKVGAEIFILPLSYVIESLQPLAQDLHSISGGEQVIHVRGEYLSMVELHKFFDIADAVQDPTQGILVILQTEGTRFALLVDQLVGQHQVVVKNLETNYRKVPGISAATILGDGNVALIIDVVKVRQAASGRARW